MTEHWQQRISTMLQKWPRLQSVSIHNRPTATGFDGSHPTVVRAVRDVRGPRFRAADSVSVPIYTDPGEEAQFDFCDLGDWAARFGSKINLVCFGMISAWSRYRVWWFTTSEDRHPTFEGMARFFDAVGGVPTACRTDRMGALGRSQGRRFQLHPPTVGAHHSTKITSCQAGEESNYDPPSTIAHRSVDLCVSTSVEVSARAHSMCALANGAASRSGALLGHQAAAKSARPKEKRTMNFTRKALAISALAAPLMGIGLNTTSVHAMSGYDDTFTQRKSASSGVTTYADVGVNFRGLRALDVKATVSDGPGDPYCTIVLAELLDRQDRRLGQIVTVGSVCGGKANVGIPLKHISTQAGDIDSVKIWATLGTGGQPTNIWDRCYLGVDTHWGNPDSCR